MGSSPGPSLRALFITSEARLLAAGGIHVLDVGVWTTDGGLEAMTARRPASTRCSQSGRHR